MMKRILLCLVLASGCSSAPGEPNGSPDPGSPGGMTGGSTPTPTPNPTPTPEPTPTPDPTPMPKPSSCVYPAGPYDKAEGAVVAPTHTWDGYLEGAQTVSTLTTNDLLDCDGKKGLNAILVAVSAQWCGACKTEAKTLEKKLAGGWKADGVRIITLMIQTNSGGKATTETAKQWRDAYKLNNVAVMADPKSSLLFSGSNSLPTNLIIDPRTMTITQKILGSGPEVEEAVDALVAKNKTTGP